MFIIIVGCGRVGAELAKLLADQNHDVVVIDRNPASFQRLGRIFNGSTLVGDGFDLDLLKSAEIKKADVFCALTNSDNTNLVAAQVAKKIFNVKKVVTRVYDANLSEIYRDLGLNIINGTQIVALMLKDNILCI